MHRILCILIVLAMLQPKECHAANDVEESLAYLFLTAAAIGLIGIGTYAVVYVARNGEELSEGRNDRFGLVESGITSSYGSSYAAGLFAGENRLLVGRYSQHLSPNRGIDFKSYELGYRHYFKVFFGEVGYFQARHKQIFSDKFSDNQWHQYRFDTYETNGGFISVGLSAQFWRFSLGVRGTHHRGLSTQTIETFENTVDPGKRLRDDARNEYRSRRTVYLDLGFAL